jgi:putative Ca2+/H+ antiporter (TMEM165/GDT1 family)
MLVADVPVVWLGRAAAAKIPLHAARAVAAALFVALALLAVFAG